VIAMVSQAASRSTIFTAASPGRRTRMANDGGR
jgi:hypothetical protein